MLRIDASTYERLPEHLKQLFRYVTGSDEVVELFPYNESRRGIVTSRPGTIYGNGAGLPSHTGVYGFDDAGSAARFFYTAKADSDERTGSGHPTVKPLSLMRWLVRLVTPPGGVVLDPFAGTGSTGAAALLEGVDSVLIEKEPAYVADIHRKLEKYRGRRARTLF